MHRSQFIPLENTVSICYKAFKNEIPLLKLIIKYAHNDRPLIFRMSSQIERRKAFLFVFMISKKFETEFIKSYIMDIPIHFYATKAEKPFQNLVLLIL